mmetsp:Transcript_7053/g.19898  ORF Transcript_7053/g.19898 Transcript_7053/m.19898 type:complete len:371 (+) Transcript_7053:6053-7165(+)
MLRQRPLRPLLQPPLSRRVTRTLLLWPSRPKKQFRLQPRWPLQSLSLPGKHLLPHRQLRLLLRPTLLRKTRTGPLLETARLRRQLPPPRALLPPLQLALLRTARGSLLAPSRTRKRRPPLQPSRPPQSLWLLRKLQTPQRQLRLLLKPPQLRKTRTGLLLGIARPRKRLPPLDLSRLSQGLRLWRKRLPPQRLLRLLQWKLPRRISRPLLPSQRPPRLCLQPVPLRRMARRILPGTASQRHWRPLQPRYPPQSLWLLRRLMAPWRPRRLLQLPLPRGLSTRLLLGTASLKKHRPPLPIRRPPHSLPPPPQRTPRPPSRPFLQPRPSHSPPLWTKRPILPQHKWMPHLREMTMMTSLRRRSMLQERTQAPL